MNSTVENALERLEDALVRSGRQMDEGMSAVAYKHLADATRHVVLTRRAQAQLDEERLARMAEEEPYASNLEFLGMAS